MIRRLAFVGCAVLATAGLSACSTFSDNDAVARVGGHELDQATLKAMVESPVGSDTLRQDVIDGQIAAVSARSMIASWIALLAIEDSGVITAEALAAATAETADHYQASWDVTPEAMQHLAALNRAAGLLIESASDVDRPQLQAGLLAAVNSAKVYVDPFYGYFDPAQISVLPLGG